MRLCVGCGAEIIGRNAGAKFCSVKCQRRVYVSGWRKANPVMSSLPSATIGAIHEYLVGIDLLRRGLMVFRALSPACKSDLAVAINSRLIFVEVTTGYRTIKGKLVHSKKVSDGIALAIVEHDGKITYDPRLELP